MMPHQLKLIMRLGAGAGAFLQYAMRQKKGGRDMRPPFWRIYKAEALDQFAAASGQQTDGADTEKGDCRGLGRRKVKSGSACQPGSRSATPHSGSSWSARLRLTQALPFR